MTYNHFVLPALLALAPLSGCRSADPGYTVSDAAPKSDGSNKTDGGASDGSVANDAAIAAPTDSSAITD